MKFDVIVIGAGAAGMMCAATAGARGRSVLLIDHSAKLAEKIRISGGGRCNFTNINATTDKGRDRFLSDNPRFALSALSRYTPDMFIALVREHGITFHEKTLGQLFCDGPATQINTMLLGQMRQAGVTLVLETGVASVSREATGRPSAIGASAPARRPSSPPPRRGPGRPSSSNRPGPLFLRRSGPTRGSRSRAASGPAFTSIGRSTSIPARSLANGRPSNSPRF